MTNRYDTIIAKMEELGFYDVAGFDGTIEGFAQKASPENWEIAVFTADDADDYAAVRAEIMGMYTDVDHDGVFFGIPYDTFINFTQDDWTALVNFMISEREEFRRHQRAMEFHLAKMKFHIGNAAEHINRFIDAGGLKPKG